VHAAAPAVAAEVPAAHGVQARSEVAVGALLSLVPAGQGRAGVQAAAPEDEEKLPGAHGEQAAAPAVEKKPARQGAQALEVATEVVPAGQSVQANAPAVAVKVPAAHGVQAVSSAEAEAPAGQGVQALAPATEVVPAGQAVQTNAPAVAVKVPAAHGVQVRSLVAEGALSSLVPAGQRVAGVQAAAPETVLKLPAAHGVQAAEPATGEWVPAGHGTQPMAPLVSANVPGRQEVHAAAPANEENWPKGHGEQDVAPALEKNPASHGTQAAAPEPSVDQVPAGQLPHVGPLGPLVQAEPEAQGLTPPRQVPWLQVSAVVQASWSSQAVPVSGVQVPSAVPPAEMAHAWQSAGPPAHAVPQQTPSTQCPGAHSAAAEHPEPRVRNDSSVALAALGTPPDQPPKRISRAPSDG